ncbi:hypothetical protein ASF61_21140 [Duganella sp. Leaf126]|nr:hypothetical protein ASF61_21140 [Duganella sp. Leaf126]
MARAAFEQAHSQHAFERSDVAANVGRWQGQQACRTGKALFIDDRHIDADCIQIEGVAHHYPD